MAFDFKKEYKEFYLPPRKPGIVTVPPMNYLAVHWHGDPNVEGGGYKRSIELLYGVAYTIKMSKRGDHRIDGYFDFVVPPLEGLWRQEGTRGVDYARKEDFDWISLIRLPDFVTTGDDCGDLLRNACAIVSARCYGGQVIAMCPMVELG